MNSGATSLLRTRKEYERLRGANNVKLVEVLQRGYQQAESDLYVPSDRGPTTILMKEKSSDHVMNSWILTRGRRHGKMPLKHVSM